MKTIYNTYIEVESQEQADRLKQVCIDNELPIFKHGWDFERGSVYFKADYLNEFWCSCQMMSRKLIKVTELEWLELLKQHKQ